MAGNQEETAVVSIINNISGGGKFTGECHYCHKTGHRKIDCFKRKKDEGEKANPANDGKNKADVIHTAMDESDDDHEVAFVAMDALQVASGTWLKAEAEAEATDHDFLVEVTRERGIDDHWVWADKVKEKLGVIGICTKSVFCYNLMIINRKLHKKGRLMLHLKTITVMSVKSAREIDAQLLAAQRESDQLKATIKKQENEAKLPLLVNMDASLQQAEMNKSAARSTDKGEHLLLGMNDSNKKDVIGPNTWLGNTGASCHLTNDDEGMFEVTMIASPVKISSGKSMTATKIGKK